MKNGLFPAFYILINTILGLFIYSCVYADNVLPPIINISGITESQYYSTAVYPQISISDLNLSYSTVTLKFNTSPDSAYVSGTEIKKDGKYRLSASAFDSAGNASYESVNFVIDKTKPSISITGVSNNAYYSTDVWFKVKISETNPVTEVIALDGNACPENETVWVREEGKHKLVVDTLDKAGNSNLKEYNFTVDKTNPKIEVSGCGEGEYYLNFIKPEILILDANLDTGSVKTDLNGSTFVSGSAIRAGGSYELKIYAVDQALNTAQVNLHFALDTTLPQIVISGVEEGSYYTTAVYPQIQITDINLDSSIIKMNDSVYVSGQEIKRDGHYELFADAYDSVGNRSEKEVNFTVDKTKPSISITGVNNNIYYSTDVWFKVKISETNPLTEVITLDGNACPENETVWVRDEGKHKLIVDTLDKGGNSNLKEYNFAVDKTLPLITIEGVEDLSAVADGSYYSTFVTPYISVTDTNLDSASLRFTLNESTFVNGTEIKEDGDYVLNVSAKDLALNSNELELHFKLMVSPRLKIITRPGDAAVFLDGDYSYPGEYKGVTGSGAEGELLIEENISIGKHLLRVKRPGYVDHIMLIAFNAGELIEKDIDLKLWKQEYFYERQLLALDSGNISLKPWVVDYDQDGKKDLVVKAGTGKNYLYLNTGADNGPEFESSQIIGGAGIFEVYYDSFAVHGSSDGKIYFDSSTILLADSTELDVGGHSGPFVFDLDHDEKDDLISGAQNGKVYFFKNTGTQGNPVFDSSQMIQAGSQDLDAGSYSRPFVVDWNNDGLYDLIIGSGDGVYVYLADDKPIDDTAPVTTAETTPLVFPGKWVYSDVSVNFTATDDMGGFESSGGTYYKLGEGAWVKGQGLEITNEGEFNISYYSVDDAGNMETTKLLKIDIDKTPPVITSLIIPDINEHTKLGVNISADVSDELSGLDTTIYQYNLNQDTAWINFKTLNLNWDSLAGQIIHFRIYAKDKAGNESNGEERAELIENINDKPEITSCIPVNKNLHIKEGEKIDFTVSVFDADYDSLQLIWYLDSAVVCEGSSEWAFHADYEDSGGHEVKFMAMDSSLAVENIWNIDVSEVAVRPPLNLTAEAGISGYILLKWDKNEYCNLLGHNVYRDSAKVNKTLVTKDRYLDSGLNDGTEYKYFIKAVDFNGNMSDKSNEVLVVSDDSSAPSIPALTINNNGLLSWPVPSDYDLAGFYLYQGFDTNNLDKKIFAGAYRDTPSSSYQLSNLLPGTQYYFAVSAYDNLNKESEKSNIVSFLFTDATAPSRVKGVKIRDTGKTGELKIKWQENSEPDLAGYKIYYGLNSLEYNTPLFTGIKDKFVLSGLNDASKYFIAVSGVDTQGNEGLKSNEEIGMPRGNSIFIQGPEPLIIDPVNMGVKLCWNSVPGVDGYKIYFGRSEDLVIAPLITADTTFTFNNLSNNKKYYAAVSSFKGKDESERVSGIILPKDVSAPDAPAGLTCLAGSDGTRLVLSWSLNKEWDLSGYKIAYKTNQEYFSESKAIGKVNRYDISGLTEGEQYFIALFARDTENNISNPSLITGVPMQKNHTYKAPPSAPLLDISCEKGSVRLNWTAGNGSVDEYRIYRREADEVKYKKISETKNLTYKNMAVEEGKIYYYVVTAVNENSVPKESIFSNEVVMRPRLKLGDIETEGVVPVAGRVDGYDLIMLSISFGAKIGEDYYNPNADLNGDGVVDGLDLSILGNNFGKQY